MFRWFVEVSSRRRYFINCWLVHRGTPEHFGGFMSVFCVYIYGKYLFLFERCKVSSPFPRKKEPSKAYTAHMTPPRIHDIKMLCKEKGATECMKEIFNAICLSSFGFKKIK